MTAHSDGRHHHHPAASVWNDSTEYYAGDLVLVKYEALPPPELAQHGACFYVANATSTGEQPAGSVLWDAQGCLSYPAADDEG